MSLRYSVMISRSLPHSQDLYLDPSIRDWVLIPITLIMVCPAVAIPYPDESVLSIDLTAGIYSFWSGC